MTKRQQQFGLIALIVIIFGGLIGWYTTRPAYENYTQVESLQNAKALESVAAKTNELEYDVIYRPNCKDCQKIEPFMRPYLKQINKHQSLLMYNVGHKVIKNLILSNNIDQTPTVLVQYHGQLLYQYSGTDKHALKLILTGTNPETNQPFDRHSNLTYYRNDFDNIKSIAPIQHLTYKINNNMISK